MASARNALNILDSAPTKLNRLRREAEQHGQTELVQDLRRLEAELSDLEYELRRLDRELR
jgi:hypothetical protein